MCGLVYHNNFEHKNVAQAVINRFTAQRTRGLNGFGFYIPEQDRLTHNTAEKRILKLLGKTVASEILFHHRIPTSTENVRNACHPFSTKDTFDHNYVMIHNGMILNDKELSDEHEKLGIKYVSGQIDGRFNDSEALMYDIALYLEGKQTGLKAEGNIAFIMVENDKDHKPLKLHFGRNLGSPLYMNHTDNELVLASEAKPEDKATLVIANKHYTFDYETKKLESTYLLIPDWEPYQHSSNNRWNEYEDNAWYRPAKNPIGFRAENSDKEESYYDHREKRYIPASQIIYASAAYYVMMADKGEALAFEILDETGNIDESIATLQERKDSYMGKLVRINQEVMRYRENSKRARKLHKERMKFWIECDLLDEAILSVEAIVREEAAELLTGNPRHEDKSLIPVFEDGEGFESFLALPPSEASAAKGGWIG